MNKEEFVKENVKQYYWSEDINCTTTTLKVLAKYFNITLDEQLIDGAVGMHGAGEYGAQCGLVDAVLIFLGIYGRKRNIAKDDIILYCHEFARQFEEKFKSLQCSTLRPEGFNSSNPPHLCESLTCNVIEFSMQYISRIKV